MLTHLDLSQEDQKLAFKHKDFEKLLKSQVNAIHSAMQDVQVTDEDYFQEGLLVILTKLEKWNPEKASLTTYCWQDLRCKMKRLKNKALRQTQLPFYVSKNSTPPNFDETVIFSQFLESLNDVEKKIVYLKLYTDKGSIRKIADFLNLPLRKVRFYVKIIKNKLMAAGYA